MDSSACIFVEVCKFLHYGEVRKLLFIVKGLSEAIQPYKNSSILWAYEARQIRARCCHDLPYRTSYLNSILPCNEDDTICLVAVKQNGAVLEYIKKQTTSISLAAINHGSVAFGVHIKKQEDNTSSISMRYETFYPERTLKFVPPRNKQLLEPSQQLRRAQDSENSRNLQKKLSVKLTRMKQERMTKSRRANL